jgi:two-component system, response regulator
MPAFENIEILLVEDSEADGEMTLRALRKNNLSNEVIWVRDGAEALDFIFGRGQFQNRQRKPKLVLLDIKMPKVNGIEVLRQIRQNEVTKLIPVVIMTSSAEDRDIVESYQLGVNSYVVKPVDFGQFMDTVGKLGYYWSLVNRVAG